MMDNHSLDLLFLPYDGRRIGRMIIRELAAADWGRLIASRDEHSASRRHHVSSPF